MPLSIRLFKVEHAMVQFTIEAAAPEVYLDRLELIWNLS